MIFSETVDLVLSGDKTQTRRIAKPHDRIMTFKASKHKFVTCLHNDQMNRTRYQVGNTYAVQPSRSAKSVGRIRLLAIRLEPLFEISIPDAMAEGILPKGVADPQYPTSYLMGFIQTWNRLYPAGTENAWENNPRVVVLEFEVDDG